MRKTKLGKSILTFMMAVIMVFELVAPPAMAAVSISSSVVYPGGTAGIADYDTSSKYSLSLGDNASTEYAGRIWTDKSVYAGDVTFDTFGGGTLTYKLNEGGNLGEDFLVAYSALATAESVEGQAQAPVDVVLILDISGSMSNDDSEMDDGRSRIANAVDAANDAIDTIMALNEYSRVGVVAFSSTATELLPLDRYTKTTRTERQWVSTGIWSGYWEDVTVTDPYFTLSNTRPSDNYAVLYTRATASDGTAINKSTNVEGGTNIQVGLYNGMNMLVNEDEVKTNINGQMVQRVPSVILLSDGSPTYSSSSEAWWAPATNNGHGPGSSAYAGNGMKAILVGSYMKDAIDRKYGVVGTNYDTTVYTVGMGITGLPGDEKDLAYMTLDPAEYWNTTNDNDMRDEIKDYWSSYTANGNTGTVSVNVGRYDDRRYYNRYVNLGHPTTNYDVDPTNGYDYVDDYYDADNASAVADVFKEIVSNISISAPQVPTEIKGDDPITSGKIVYTDPIGQYMEVKDVKAIIYAGKSFTLKAKTTNGTTDTYVFEGEVHSDVYGDRVLADIIITVTRDAKGDETLVVEIPASVIPLRVNYVTLNEDGTVKSHTNNGSMPARVIYSVGLRDEIVKLDDNGNVYVDRTQLSDEYIAANTNADGTVDFYSNLYTGTNTVNGSTAGDATVVFEPSHSNPFYYILEDMPIYKDAQFTQQVTAGEGLSDTETYFYKEEFYHGSATEVLAIARTGAQLKKTAITTGDDGNLYRAAGSPRLNRILEFEGRKIANATETAQDFYAPTFEYADGSTDAYDGYFKIYLGNNGVISLHTGGDLEITKKVDAAAGLTAPDKEFVFTLDLNGQNVSDGVYNYVIVDKNGEEKGSGTVSKDSPTITLKDGETATVYSLPPGTTYVVTEAKVDGFNAASEGASGVIEAGKTAKVVYTNSYFVDPVVYPTDGELEGKKVFTGRSWTDGDSFAFFMVPYNNAPLPDNYDVNEGVVVTAPDTPNGDTATFNFGNITFTAPGIYRYTITEKEPTSSEYLPGVNYSRALYRVVVEVVDNGNGTLSIASSDVQRLYDDGANPLFTYNNANEIVMNQGEEGQDDVVFNNEYSADSVVRVPVALKDYTDTSNTKPLVSGMFEFRLEAVGYLDDAGALVENKAVVPMPSDAVNGVSVTSNEGRNITFHPIEFAQDCIPQGQDSIVFRYKMTEAVPANRLHGMTYDTTEYYIDVKVSIDPANHVLAVEPAYTNGGSVPVFRNVYTPDPATVFIDGTKTLNGRDMKDGEAFEFVLEGADAATNNAVRNQEVVIPSDNAYVTGGKDGIASNFMFRGIQFKKAGTYTFTVKETKGNSPSVVYDETVYTVTVVIADENGDGVLEAQSVSYSGGSDRADFINEYSATFEGTPVTLKGTKKLLGKSLLKGEFFFNVVEYYNGQKVSEGLVSHTEDTEPDSEGAYYGEITFISDRTYDKAGVYTYEISEQIPDPKVGGTTYDETKYRYTVVVDDVDMVGKLTVISKYIEVWDGNDWGTPPVGDVGFVNVYEPAPAIASLPLIKKVLAGDRADGLKAGEFEFELKLISTTDRNGIQLPTTTVVTNGADGSVLFDDIIFTKAGEYVVSVSEVIPSAENQKPGVTYSTQVIIASFNVVDDRNGKLTAVLTNFVGGDIIVNSYLASPATATIDITKRLDGRAWLNTDSFDFEVVVLDPATQQAIAEGAIEFPTDNSGEEIEKKTIDTEGETITGLVTIHRPGTYKFIVREITGNISGIHYDSKPREIEIVAEDDSDNAEIVIRINGELTDEYTVTFINEYDAESTELSGHDHLTVEKVFTGRPNDKWLDTDEFVFKLEAGDDATAAAIEAGDVELPDETTHTISDANKAHPHFGNIIFHKEGTYKFKVTEIAGNIPGITYDRAEKIVTVIVTNDTAAGALVATVDRANSDALTFTNVYETESVTVVGETDLVIYKNIVGRDWFEDDEFEFVLEAFGQIGKDAIAAGDIIMPSSNRVVITNENENDEHGDKTAHFGDIKFTKPGAYKFVITETAGDIENMDYDTHICYVDILVTDNGEGQLVATVSYSGSQVFINNYTPDPVSVQLEGTKVLLGDRELKEGEFEFVLSAVTENAPMPRNTVVKNDENGKIVFDKIYFDDIGSFVYKISETKGNIPGVTYDGEEAFATVRISYNPTDGTYVITVKYTKGFDRNVDTFEFVNEYKTENADPVVIEVEKTVSASDGNSYTVKGGEFTFEIEGKDNAPMPGDTTVENDADGKASFGGIVFDKAGTYTYTVTEKKQSQAGFTYDETVYTVVVVVTDDTATAKLKTRVVITDESGAPVDKITFNNGYDPDEATAAIFGEKKVEGGYREVEKEQFSFTITGSEGAPMPAQTTVKNNEFGQFTFGTISYDKVGTYTYTVTEVNTGYYGYTYDTRSFTVTVTVADVDGQLVATVDGIGTAIDPEIVFVNTYKPDPATAAIEAEKVLQGKLQLKENDFEFVLSAVTENAPMPAETTVKNGADGSIVFGPITFTEAGTYEYTITEKKGDMKGVTYDEGVVNVKVEVTFSDAAGMLFANVTYTKGSENTAVFTNKYEAEKTSPVVIDVEKVVTASEGNSFKLNGNEFSFTITGEEGAPMPTEATVKNDKNGKASFGGILFDKEGVYTYTVREESGSIGGMTYDDEIYTVTVTVTDDTANAKLVADVVVKNKAGQETEIVFNNSYDPKSASATVFGNKVLNGGHKNLEANEFEFVITAVTDKAPMPAETTVKNDATGAFSFGAITFDRVGVYEYEITEKNLGKNGYTYDSTKYTVTVTVTDENGELVVDVDGLGTTADPTVEFVNKYEPETVELTVGADGELVKELDGRELKEGEFEFVLESADGKTVKKDKNDKNGKFEFTLEFTKAGEYDYTITETKGNLGGVTYDDSVYGLKVVVVDRDGKLVVSDYYFTSGSSKTDSVVYNNKYEAKPIEVEIEATKIMLERDLGEGEFTFELKDKDGKVIDTSKNGENGKIVFKKITLDKVGTYTYTVSEVKGSIEGVTYDNAVFTVEYVVTDDEAGSLVSAKPTIKKSGSNAEVNSIEFTNTYKPPHVPQTGDSELILWFALLFMSGTGVLATAVFGKKKAKR